MSSQYNTNSTEISRNIRAQKIIYKFRNFLYSNRRDIREQFFRMSRDFFDNEYQNNIALTATERERLRLLLNHWDWNTFDTNARDWWFSLSFNHSNSYTLMIVAQLWTDDVQIFDSDNFETATDGLR